MNHLTLNTGSLTAFDPARCQPAALAAVRRIWPDGGALPSPWNDLRMDFGTMPGGASFCIWRADVPLLFNAVCLDHAHSPSIFSVIESEYLSMSERSPEIMSAIGTASHVSPPESPWLATLILPSIFMALPPQVLHLRLSTIASLEQAAAAFIHHQP